MCFSVGWLKYLNRQHALSAFRMKSACAKPIMQNAHVYLFFTIFCFIVGNCMYKAKKKYISHSTRYNKKMHTLMLSICGINLYTLYHKNFLNVTSYRKNVFIFNPHFYLCFPCFCLHMHECHRRALCFYCYSSNLPMERIDLTRSSEATSTQWLGSAYIRPLMV